MDTHIPTRPSWTRRLAWAGVGPADADRAAGKPRTQKANASQRFQQAILAIHRWIGIIACVYLVVWFVSGLVLAYVRFPAMSTDEKLELLPAIEWSQVKVTPDQALAGAGLTVFPHQLTLEMAGGAPVYRILDWNKTRRAVSAVTGFPAGPVNGEQALQMVRRQLRAPQATLLRADLERDQWTVTGYWNKERPFHVIAMNDAPGTQYYVSVATGEIVLDTQRYERIWNWVGAIPHWLYFEFIRASTGVWQWVVYILAGAGIFVALSGMWIGFSRLRLRSRYANGKASPFRGWMKWHHVSGVIGGVFLSLWIISGFFTMYPGGLLEKRGVERSEFEAFAGATSVDLKVPALAAIEGKTPGARRAGFAWVGGEPLVYVEDGRSPPRLFDAGAGAPRTLAVDDIVKAARAMLPSARVAGAVRLETGDEYWHSGFYEKKLPAVRVRFDDPAGTWFHIDPETGHVLGLVDATARLDRWTVVALHDLDWHWLLQRRPLWDIVLFAVTLPGLLIAVTAVVVGWRRLRRVQLVPAGFATASRLAPGWETPAPAIARAARTDTVLVTFASQTGGAEQLAEKTADSFRAAGHKVAVCGLGDVDLALLGEVRRAIFVVATTGDGDAPDHAMAFERRVMRQAGNLEGLDYALLSLGDREYSRFCGFGAAVDTWLDQRGARRLFPSVEADGDDPAALAAWAQSIARYTGRVEEFGMERASYAPWRLVARRLANPGSAGRPAYYLELEPAGGVAPIWEAGDIAQIAAGLDWETFGSSGAEIVEREYSIASIPADGRIHLLVRQMPREDGGLGLASGFLTDGHGPGLVLPLRVRRNRSFHGPGDDRPMILIGNGTGIAGLRAHLRRRAALGHDRNWLIFGERNRAVDSFYGEEIAAGVAAGRIARFEVAFSRDAGMPRYVQHALSHAAAQLRVWVEEGAAIYVCGSLQGMAPAVTEVLHEVLGEDGLDTLIRLGRYRRDVY